MKRNERVSLKVNASHLSISGISDPGCLRTENEDTIFLDESGHFMLLADGMGGHERGAEASETAINVIREFLNPEVLMEELMDITDAEGIPTEVICLTSLVEDAIQKANSVIYKRNQEAGLQRYMGTTLVGLVPVQGDGNYMLWFHVGDSRLYRWRDSRLERLTVDHSAYLEWERNGQHGKEPPKNIITRAVGPHEMVMADIGYDKWQKNDIYILCSDGLTDMISEDTVSKLINTEKSVDTISTRLVDAANEAGGKDNVSAVVCKV